MAGQLEQLPGVTSALTLSVSSATVLIPKKLTLIRKYPYSYAYSFSFKDFCEIVLFVRVRERSKKFVTHGIQRSSPGDEAHSRVEYL